MTVELWLVRHARTAWNAEGRYQGWADVPLDDVGRAQARRLGRRLAGTRFERVVASDLVRAVETARLAVGEPTVDPRLRELDLGAIEGRRWDDLDDDVQRRLLADGAFTAPDGESVDDLRGRALAALDELPAGRHAVVTHGGVVRVAMDVCGTRAPAGHATVTRLDWTRHRVLAVPTIDPTTGA